LGPAVVHAARSAANNKLGGTIGDNHRRVSTVRRGCRGTLLHPVPGWVWPEVLGVVRLPWRGGSITPRHATREPDERVFASLERPGIKNGQWSESSAFDEPLAVDVEARLTFPPLDVPSTAPDFLIARAESMPRRSPITLVRLGWWGLIQDSCHAVAVVKRKGKGAVRRRRTE
jgi:hypothetical protein